MILVTDALGRLMLCQAAHGDTVVPVQALSDACYWVLVVDGNGSVLERAHFIKQ